MKYSIATLFSLFLLSSLSAQNFRYGASVAPAASWWIVEGDNYISSGTSIGFQLGGMIDLTLGEQERFALHSGLNFTSAPGSYEQNPEVPSFQGKSWDFAVTTLDLPVLLRLRSNVMGKTVLFAQYGVTLGFTLTDKVTVNDGKGGGDDFDYEGSNTSLTMGAGLEYALNDDMGLMFTAFFQNGIKNMVINNLNPDNDSRYFPQQIGIRAGVLF